MAARLVLMKYMKRVCVALATIKLYIQTSVPRVK